MKQGRVVDQVVGANKAALESKLQSLSSGEAGPSKPAAPGGHVDLSTYILQNQVDALNQNMKHPVANIFRADPSYLESDCDEQLILTILFSQQVKLHSIQLKALSLSHAPKTIRLFVNRIGLSFDDVESIQETQRLDLTEESYEAAIPLRYVKFQNVNSLTLFIQDTIGEKDVTQLQQIVLLGSALQVTDMKDLKKVEE
jgi:hypothetical protein